MRHQQVHPPRAVPELMLLDGAQGVAQRLFVPFGSTSTPFCGRGGVVPDDHYVQCRVRSEPHICAATLHERPIGRRRISGARVTHSYSDSNDTEFHTLQEGQTEKPTTLQLG